MIKAGDEKESILGRQKFWKIELKFRQLSKKSLILVRNVSPLPEGLDPLV